MPGLYSGFDATRADWEFPEGICAGILGYPSDPESDGLESNHTTGDTGQQAVPGALDNDPDTAVKVGHHGLLMASLSHIISVSDLILRCGSGRGPDQLGRGALAGRALRERHRQPARGRKQARLRLAARVRRGGARC